MERDVDYFLSKGMDRPMAEYFASGRKRLVGVSPNPDFSLILTYDDGERRRYDCKPLLERGRVFAPFREYENFRRVHLDEEAHCVAWDIDPAIDSKVVWENQVDLCPDSCYVDSEPIP